MTDPILQGVAGCAPVCLQGFGWMGCVLAWHLHRHRTAFVWMDNDSHVNAWRGSAGCVYPGNDERLGYGQWREWMRTGAPWGSALIGTAEKAAWWQTARRVAKTSAVREMFDGGEPASVKPEHPETAGLKQSTEPALIIDVPSFVLRTRAHFERFRVKERPDKSPLVIAHGFNSRLTKYSWGWTAVVTLKLDPVFRRESGKARPAFNIQVSRYRWRKAFPLPGKPDLWLASGCNQVASVPLEYNPEPKIQQWAAEIREATDDRVSCASVEEVRFGWRPCCPDGSLLLKGDKPFDPLEVRRLPDGVWELPPLGDRGVRLAPVILERFNKAAPELLGRA